MGKMEENMQNALLKQHKECCTQFEITSNLLRNLYKLDLTPVTKLVLLELTTHLNEGKNGSVVFPSVGYIAEVLGIGLTAAKKAINDLIKQGLIIKTKRDKIKGNYNKYVFTQKVRNLTAEPSENEFLKQSENDLFYIRTNKKEQKNNKEEKGGNVYSGDDEILADYAAKHGAKSIQAYINALKSTKSAEKIIKEYKSKNIISKKALRNIEETQDLIESYEVMKNNSCSAESCGYSLKQILERKRNFI